MQITDRSEAPTAVRTDLGAIFVSLELSRSAWLITSLSPGSGEAGTSARLKLRSIRGCVRGACAALQAGIDRLDSIKLGDEDAA
jgi:hypothetical protein